MSVRLKQLTMSKNSEVSQSQTDELTVCHELPETKIRQGCVLFSIEIQIEPVCKFYLEPNSIKRGVFLRWAVQHEAA